MRAVPRHVARQPRTLPDAQLVVLPEWMQSSPWEDTLIVNDSGHVALLGGRLRPF
jgi:hypothetical protein